MTIPAFHPDIEILAAEAEIISLIALCELADTDDKVHELTLEIIALEERMAEVVAVTVDGMMAQLRLLKSLGEDFMWDEGHVALVDCVISGLERLSL